MILKWGKTMPYIWAFQFYNKIAKYIFGVWNPPQEPEHIPTMCEHNTTKFWNRFGRKKYHTLGFYLGFPFLKFQMQCNDAYAMMQNANYTLNYFIKRLGRYNSTPLTGISPRDSKKRKRKGTRIVNDLLVPRLLRLQNDLTTGLWETW